MLSHCYVLSPIFLVPVPLSPAVSVWLPDEEVLLAEAAPEDCFIPFGKACFLGLWASFLFPQVHFPADYTSIVPCRFNWPLDNIMSIPFHSKLVCWLHGNPTSIG